MGLFKKLQAENLVQAPNASQANGVSLYLQSKCEVPDPYVPIGQGNLYEVNAYLNMINKQFMSFYKMYLLERQYFTNLWRVEGCPELHRIWPAVTKSIFDYGRMAVKKMGDKYIPFSIANITMSDFYTVKEAQGIIISPTDGFYDMSKVMKVPLTEEDTVFVKSNYNGYPALLYWYDVLKGFIDYQTVNNTNLLWLAKKAIYKVRNGSSERISQELASMTSLSSPYAVIQEGFENGKPSANGDNALEVLATPGNAQNDFWHSFREFQSFWYQHLGRRHNVSFKKERNVSSETEIAEVAFDILEYETKYHLELFIEDWNKKFGFNAKLVNVGYTEEQAHADAEQDKALFKEMEGEKHYDNNK